MFSWFSIGVFAAFSYPLMYPFVWLVLLFSAYLLMEKDLRKLQLYISVFHKRIITIPILCLLGYTGIETYHYARAEVAWKEVINSSFLIKNRNRLLIYEDLYRDMRTNRYFLYNYSIELYQTKEYQRSLEIALQCRNYWADYDLELLLGQLYEQSEQPEEAERYYRSASYMCPNRFIPLYRLVLLLDKEKRPKEAKEIAKRIVEKTEKVPLHIISQIKREMRDLLSREF